MRPLHESRGDESREMTELLLEVSLTARYGSVPVLEGVQFSVERGEALGLIGTSGAGKSTLVMALMGLLPWCGGIAAGHVLFEGRNLLTMREREARHLRGKTFALIPQSPMSSLNRALTLRAHFEEAWRAHRKNAYSELGERVQELLEQVQLPGGDFLARKPGQISVGQAQRVLIALALLHRPSLLIADEPTSALDPVTQIEILRLLRRLNRESGTALLYISHDLLSVLKLCSRVAVLSGGRIAESIAVDDIAKARHSATRSLLNALPVPPEVLRQYEIRDEGGRTHLDTVTELPASRVDEEVLF